MDIEEKNRMLRGYRGRRFLICRAINDVSKVIAALGEDDGSDLPPHDVAKFPIFSPSQAQKDELDNMAANLLRMILLWNDGGISHSKLNHF